MNFPQFWFFGHDIRLVIRGACDDLLKSFSGVDNCYIRASLYAIDRNLAVLLAQPYLQRDPSIFVLSDRGPYSSCVTTGYLWANGMLSEKEVKEQIVPDMFETVDEGMLTFFDQTSLVCVAEGSIKDTGLGTRKALDNYESEMPQIYSAEVYKMLNLPEIVTKKNGKWRRRAVLAYEALDRVAYPGVEAACMTEAALESDDILLDAYAKGRLLLVGPRMMLHHFGAKNLIDTELEGDLQRWEHVSLTKSEIPNQDRKELLDVIETKLALTIKDLASQFEFTDSNRFRHSVNAIRKIIDRYPVIMDILDRTSGKKMTGFLNALMTDAPLRFA